MTKLDSKHQSLTLSSASRSDPLTCSGRRLEPVRRLLVLVPSLETNLAAVTSRVQELANAAGACVQFLGLYSDPAHELSLRRELVTMSAMVKDGRVSAEVEVIFGKDWVDVVKKHYQPGDMVVCFAEQRVGLSHRPLSQVLQSKLDIHIPLFILSDLYHDDQRSNWFTQAAAWMGSIAIILSFFVIQVKLDHLAQDWTHIVLPLLTIPVEVWMIWVWNSLFE